MVVIHDSKNNILLLERADRKDFWQSVTGSISSINEPLFSAAKRELMEETGIDATLYKMKDWKVSRDFEIFSHWQHRFAEGVTENKEHFFSILVPRSIKVTLSKREHLSYCWVNPNRAMSMVFSWTNKEAIRDLIYDSKRQ